MKVKAAARRRPRWDPEASPSPPRAHHRPVSPAAPGRWSMSARVRTRTQRQPQSPNQTLISTTNDTESSSPGVPNDTTNKGRTGDNSPGIEALCVIYFTYAVIISVGILGNAILIKVFFKTKSMQTVPNIFITSLAFGDLLLLLTCVPVDATHYLAEGWLFGRIGCKVLSFIRLTSVGVSVFTLTILSADRYKAVVKPLERQPSNAILKTCAKAGCIWIVSMLIALPEAIFSNVYTFHDPNRNMTFEACASYPVSERLLQEIHSLLCFLVFYIIPLSIISVYYSLIARTLYKSTLNIPTEEQSHARTAARKSPKSSLHSLKEDERTGDGRILCNHLGNEEASRPSEENAV